MQGLFSLKCVRNNLSHAIISMQLSCKTLNLADVLSLRGNCSTSLGFLCRLGLVSNCVYT